MLCCVVLCAHQPVLCINVEVAFFFFTWFHVMSCRFLHVMSCQPLCRAVLRCHFFLTRNDSAAPAIFRVGARRDPAADRLGDLGSDGQARARVPAAALCGVDRGRGRGGCHYGKKEKKKKVHWCDRVER